MRTIRSFTLSVEYTLQQNGTHEMFLKRYIDVLKNYRIVDIIKFYNLSNT